MTNPLATADFFALEAGECLDRLELLARRDDAPPAEDFLRASRVLRGSALMASQQAIARAAGGLESVARALREGRRAWDLDCREQVAQAMKVMDEGYLEQGYYKRQKAKIQLEVEREETFTYENYSWTEHISRKWGQWYPSPEELLEQLWKRGFEIEERKKLLPQRDEEHEDIQ